MVTMTRSIGEPIEVMVRGDEHPSEFIWRGRTYRIVDTGGRWRLLGRWWEGDGERHFIRVATDLGRCFDLCRYASTEDWHVYRVWD